MLICWADSRRLQSQCNNIEDDDDIKLLLTYIKKVQNIAEVGTLPSNKIAPSTKGVVDGKKVDINVRKWIYTTS